MNDINIIESTKEEADLIDNKIYQFNNKVLGMPEDYQAKKLNFVIKENDKVIAGINACVFAKDVCYVDILFVEEEYRKKGLGTKLLQKVENDARNEGVRLIHLDTFDWQAKDFYLKYGYEIFGILENCPQGHKRFYMKKDL